MPGSAASAVRVADIAEVVMTGLKKYTEIYADDSINPML